MKRRRLLLILLFGLMLLSACSGFSAAETPTPIAEPEEPYVPVVSATGEVVPEQWVVLSMTTAGVVDRLFVSEDDDVEAGQMLLRLQGSEHLMAAIAAARYELAIAKQALDDLYAYPQLRVAQALQAVADARKAVRDAERRVNNLMVTASQADIDQARANLVLAKDKLDKAQEGFAPYENKPESNIIRAALLSKLAQAQKEYEAAVRKLNNLLGTANEIDLAQAEANLQLAQAQLDAAEQDYSVLSQGPDPKDVALAEARLENAQAQLAAAEAALNDLELKAPFAGTVSELYVRLSEWVTPGQPILLLADLQHLRVETTDLNEIDVARIKVGDKATVTFDALPDVVVEGTVAHIATKASEGAGVNYKVIIELAEIPDRLRWGMTAFVDIEVEE
jgi:multidrug resistance efflux pump